MRPERADPTASAPFAARTTVEQVEAGLTLAPKFDADGLIPCVTTDADIGDVLMLGYMDRDALQRTIATGEAHYWSRSHRCLRRKGTTSGLVQTVVEMRIDDDQDTVWLRVRVSEPDAGCHVGYRSRFYRSVDLDLRGAPEEPARLVFVETPRNVDPKEVFGDAPNPTRLSRMAICPSE